MDSCERKRFDELKRENARLSRELERATEALRKARSAIDGALDRTPARARFFFDMDGVLAKWRQSATVEETYEDNYFLELEPEPSAIETVLKLMEEGREVFALSAAWDFTNAMAEKRQWLDENGLERLPSIFVPCGRRKADYVQGGGVNVLVDDYTKNLTEWQEAGEGFVPIKFMNGVNGTNGTWTGAAVNREMGPDEMADAILSAARERV